MQMKKNLMLLCVLCTLFFAENLHAQEVDSLKVETTENLASNKTEKNRNEMLNAENSPGPRNVNIGLPFGGDITILENGLPVVYTFYPTSPTMTWRNDNSLSRMGLMSFTESAITTGKVGYAVQSTTREASNSFKGYASVYGNSFGSSRYDMTITGPFQNGWGYMLSFYQSFDRGNGINFQFTPWYDRATNAKGAIQKKYSGGSVRLLYKYNNVKALMSNYQPLIYKGDGKTEELTGFKLGKDSYLLGNGKIPTTDPWGKLYTADLDDDKHSTSESHSIYLDGNHKFKGDFLKGWKLDYSAMYQDINSPFSVTFPISLLAFMPDQQGNDKYYYHGTTNRHEGNAQWVMTNMIPQSDNKYLTARAELTKKVADHDLRFGLNYQNYKRKYQMNYGMYAQTVEPNPQLLDLYSFIPAYNMEIKMSQDNGVFPAAYAGTYGEYYDENFLKTALYLSDDWQITRAWSLGVGARLEHQNINENKYPSSYTMSNGRSTPEPYSENITPIKYKFENYWNYVLAANSLLKITPKFGLLAEGSLNSWVESYWDYENRDAQGAPQPDANGKYRKTSPKMSRLNVVNFGGGVYFNLGTQLSVVSKVTSISKTNVRFNETNISNPADPTESRTFDPLFYDISTLGWTTDMMASPVKNFNIHFLLTLQKPVYKNFSISAFGVTYDYNDKIIPELSQVLMEIDPSYTFMGGKMRGWVSLRYFGKQYGNPTNAFFYNARLENFCGLDYNVSRNFGLKLQVTNFLDQAGVRGAVQGANQITDASPYTDRIIVANGIRPRTVELTANIKF
jgi:hypothetical protein